MMSRCHCDQFQQPADSIKHDVWPSVFTVLTAFSVAALAVGWLARSRAARLALDAPNERSLHAVPVPRSGGIGLLLGVASGWALVVPHLPWPFWAALVLLATVSLIDDLRGLSAFVRFSAPDLALTQLSVEVVSIILLLLALYLLPQQSPAESTTSRKLRDAALAIAAGGGVAALVYAVLTRPQQTIAGYFLENSVPGGGGTNVVNVILVDFRGFDTLGEITVVGIVAITVYKLLRRFRPAPESIAPPRAQQAGTLGEPEPATVVSDPLPHGYMRVPAVLGRLLMPVAAVISVFFLLRGHNAPGGGFVGGLVMSTAFVVQYMVSGTQWIESRMRIHPQYWIAGGLLAAGGAGVSPWLLNREFLTSLEADLHLPLLGELHISTTLLFDLGVYLLVVGATTLILVAIAHQSLRTHRRHDEEVEIEALLRSPGSGGQP